MPDRGRSARRGAEALVRFLAYLDQLEAAVIAREPMRITALLRKRTATHLPREVREELLLLSRLSRETLRAPIQFLRFQHRMQQLAAGGEPLPTAQIELPFDATVVSLHEGEVRRPPGERRPAASNPADPADDD